MLCLLGLLAARTTCSQSCPAGNIDTRALSRQIVDAGNRYRRSLADNPGTQPSVSSTTIYRASAIGGKAMIPALRTVSRTWMPPDEVPGAAQVSLAKLGDTAAMRQLASELDGSLPLTKTRSKGWTVRKLALVGNDWSVSVLMDYLDAHRNDLFSRSDPSKQGDVGLLRPGLASGFGIVNELGCYALEVDLGFCDTPIRNPPPRIGDPEADVKVWADWWEESKRGSVLWAIQKHDFRDPRLQCLVRKVNWGFPDAIVDLATLAGQDAEPILAYLATVGDKSEPTARFDTVRGHAQTALAILGDEVQFNAIVRELDTLRFKDATRKLAVVGGKRSVAVLIGGFDNPNFLRDRPDYTGDKEHIAGIMYDRDEAIARALVSLVLSPPDTSGAAESKEQWKQWWADNKDTAKFSPRSTYE